MESRGFALWRGLVRGASEKLAARLTTLKASAAKFFGGSAVGAI
jgi:hypothetical protein